MICCEAGEIQLIRLLSLLIYCLTASLDEVKETISVQLICCIIVALKKQGLFFEVS